MLGLFIGKQCPRHDLCGRREELFAADSAGVADTAESDDATAAEDEIPRECGTAAAS